MRRHTRLTFAATATLTMLAAPAAAADGPPRPGCGYGDDQHNHQAAPGQDPLSLRPGLGIGDQNHEHTAPPGSAPEDGGQEGDPARGCQDDLRGG